MRITWTSGKEVATPAVSSAHEGVGRIPLATMASDEDTDATNDLRATNGEECERASLLFLSVDFRECECELNDHALQDLDRKQSSRSTRRTVSGHRLVGLVAAIPIAMVRRQRLEVGSAFVFCVCHACIFESVMFGFFITSFR